MSAAIDRLIVEQRVGQLFAIGFPGTEPTEDVLDLIRRRHVGNIILFSRNIHSAAQTLELTTRLQQVAREAGHPAPLLIMTDQEGGLVRRLGAVGTKFPGNMALGATRSADLAYAVARATARELQALGINLNLAPVVDVNSNPANPVIGVRAYGEDPALVARLGVAAMHGYAEGGVVPTLKHFPGHGDTAIDSHLALPVISATRDALDRTELVPFVSGIAHGAECIMLAHIALPTLMPSGDTVPASLSRPIAHGLLREQLGFTGVAITDCLEMNAVAEGIGVARGAVLALLAGNDLVLISHRPERQHAAIDAVLDAIAAGELSPERVAEAADRVLRLKQRHLHGDRLPTHADLVEVASEAHRELATRAFSAATTVIRDDTAQLPLSLPPDARVLIVAVSPTQVTMAAEPIYDASVLLASVRRFHLNTTLKHVVPTDDAQLEARDTVDDVIAEAAAANVVLLVTLSWRSNAREIETAARIALAARRVVGIAACSPYDAGALPDVGTFLATYEYSAPALAAAIDVLFGARSATGLLPVRVVRREDEAQPT